MAADANRLEISENTMLMARAVEAAEAVREEQVAVAEVVVFVIEDENALLTGDDAIFVERIREVHEIIDHLVVPTEEIGVKYAVLRIPIDNKAVAQVLYFYKYGSDLEVLKAALQMTDGTVRRFVLGILYGKSPEEIDAAVKDWATELDWQLPVEVLESGLHRMITNGPVSFLGRLHPTKATLAAGAGFLMPLLKALADHQALDIATLANALIASGFMTVALAADGRSDAARVADTAATAAVTRENSTPKSPAL